MTPPVEPETDPVTLTIAHGVALITLDRPATRNALALAVTQGLADAVGRARRHPEMGALVVAANGPVFSAGGALDELLAPRAPLREMYAGFLAIADAGVPTVAAVAGPALGAGLNVALACDVIVCSPEARFESRFLDIGLHPGGAHLWRLRQRIGRQGAAAMAIFGDTVSGEEAVRLGLAWRCVASSEVLTEAMRLARRAAARDDALVSRTMATLDAAAGQDVVAAVETELDAQHWSMQRPEFATGLARMRTRLGRTTGPRQSSA
jgi:enoyl-CoA hydratase